MLIPKIEITVITTLVVGILVAGWVDNDITKLPSDNYIYCEHPEKSDICQVVNKDGDFVSDISFKEASDAKFFSHQENIQNWLDVSAKYEVAKEVK